MARVDVVMPKMGESVMEGTVLEWKKAVGDAVEADETLLEISTDKVDSEVPSPEAGRIVEILVEENETVDVGTPIAVIETDVNAEVGAAPEAAPPAEDASADEDPIEDAAEPLTEVQPVGEDPQPEPEAKPAAPPVRPAGDAPAAPASGGARTEVVMPKMGESVMEGTVLEWKKAVGDAVEADETLLEISTDKVDSEVPSPEAGTLLEILVEEGETVDVGTPIAVIGAAGAAPVEAAPAGGDGSTSLPTGSAQADEPEPYEKSYGGEASDAAAAAAPAVQEERGAEAAAAATASAEPAGPIPTRDDAGNFYSPLVRSIAEAEGIRLSELQQISGSGADGRVSKADVMAYLESRDEAPAQPASAPAPEPKSYGAESPAPQAAPATPAAAPAPQARQAPTAPSKPVSKPAPAASGDTAGERVEVVEMDRMRQLIAEHMRRSKDTSAHVTSFAEVDVTGLVRHREAHKAEFQQREGVKLTYTPYFIEAAIEPLRDHPLLNASVEGTRVLIKKDYHVGIAVALGTKGLLVPVVRNAGQQNLTGLAHNVADLADRARSKKLQPDELQGGTFTITNVGSLGSLMGTPIINQPQTAILSPGAIVKRPVVVDGPDGGDVIAIRHMVYISLSYDHRIIDGAMAASFLAAYRHQLESYAVDTPLA
ncbi:2-oxo acid dehydrogenase subunit E2 [Rubrivirga marina]|uniref:Dihydrolipoamide acetyltransferase component of pyruvate dehydrogenase complex n=1 Tax=Rubrivirga marina TaxID=1196024 RepID=A0A271J7A9_9BACT|nr:2-oxo acid dehydrogenase subunit E2 [Rubrivirga marina]PAP78529.1 dihydrolipoamide acetyltransferase [Rubrivirga marina]